jgi:hypothetical protein
VPLQSGFVKWKKRKAQVEELGCCHKEPGFSDEEKRKRAGELTGIKELFSRYRKENEQQNLR